MFKKAICAIVGFGCIICAVGFSSVVAHNYTMNGIVDSINDDYITVEDSTGNLWDYDFDEVVTRDSFKVNEKVEISFNDNCSDSNRTDDVIIKIEKR